MKCQEVYGTTLICIDHVLEARILGKSMQYQRPIVRPIVSQYIWYNINKYVALSVKGPQGRSHYKKNRKIWDKVPKGGGGSDPNPIFFFRISFFLTTNLASPYLKTCFTVKIWLNLMHTNLIARIILTTVPVTAAVQLIFCISQTTSIREGSLKKTPIFGPQGQVALPPPSPAWPSLNRFIFLPFQMSTDVPLWY